MEVRVVRTSLTWLLLAAVFLGSVILPAVQHAHAEHDHASTSQTATASVTHSHHHCHCSTQPSTIDEFPTWHLHLSLFGWDVTWPTGDSSNGSSPGTKSCGDSGEYLVRLVDADTILVSTQTLEWLTFALPCMTSGMIVEPSTIVHSLHANSPESPLLCDSARGERSGVQLI